MVATVPNRDPDIERSGPRHAGSSSAPGREPDPRIGSAIANLLLAEDGERAALADILHDQPVQVLTAAGIRLGTVARFGGENDATLEQIQERVDVSIAQLRRLMRGLRRTELDEGLIPALSRELSDVTRALPDTPASIESQALDGRPSAGTSTLCFRLVQAALASVSKQPAPTAIALRVEGATRLSCTLVATGEDPATRQQRLEDRVGAWLTVLGDVGGTWAIRRNPSAVSFSFELPSAL